MAGEQILVVEDNEKNMKLLPRRPSGDGLPDARGDDRRAGGRLAAEHVPGLVLMDIRLPDIDGVEALRRLRADERTASIPVLALTAQAMEGDRERFLAAGFDGYVSKPSTSSSSSRPWSSTATCAADSDRTRPALRA